MEHPLSSGDSFLAVPDSNDKLPRVPGHDTSSFSIEEIRPKTWRQRTLQWFDSLLTEEPGIGLDRLKNWFETLRDRRFYASGKGLEFEYVDHYFRQVGFEMSKGMTLKPDRKVLIKVPSLSGLVHPREQIHVISPGDPVFQRHCSGSTGASGVYDPTASPELSAYQPDPTSQAQRLSELAPELIVTSQRIIHLGDSVEEPDTKEWFSHFYSDIIGEAPAILSWVDGRGWKRRLGNDEDRYYSRVRYYDTLGKRCQVVCPDQNSSALVSWIIQQINNRNVKRRRRSLSNAAVANDYLERKVHEQHLTVLDILAHDRELESIAEVHLIETPLPIKEGEENAGEEKVEENGAETKEST
jgi:hypothetical protein